MSDSETPNTNEDGTVNSGDTTAVPAQPVEQETPSVEAPEATADTADGRAEQVAPVGAMAEAAARDEDVDYPVDVIDVASRGEAPGYPAETVDGKLVRIVEKRGNGQESWIVDADGNEYDTDPTHGSLVPREAA